MATIFGFSERKSKLRDGRESPATDKSLDAVDRDILAANMCSTAECAAPYDLSLLVENLVIPRLIAGRSDLLLQSESRAPMPDHKHAAPPVRRMINDHDVDTFARLSVHEEAHVLLAFVDEQLAAGSSVETIFVELLAPAARCLGAYWNADSEDFVGVTMGLWRIQEVLRVLTMRIPPIAGPGHGQRSALFSPMPGEQHSFGTLMVAECFHRAGWETDVLIEPTQSELTGKFAKRHYDLIGLTVSNDCSTSALSSLVSTIKAVSSNPQVRILLGGRVINEHPDLVASCGADATATDALSAVAIANQLVPLRAARFDNLS